MYLVLINVSNYFSVIHVHRDVKQIIFYIIKGPGILVSVTH